VSAVTAQHGNQRNAAFGHPACREAGVLDALAQGQVEELQGRPVTAARLAAVAVFQHGGGNASHVRGHQHPVDTRGAKGRQQALDHRDLVGAGKQPGVGGQSPHVAAGGRVGNDAYGQRRTTHDATNGRSGKGFGQDIGHLFLLLGGQSGWLPEQEQGRCQVCKNACITAP
jgi:hypothetical protein